MLRSTHSHVRVCAVCQWKWISAEALKQDVGVCNEWDHTDVAHRLLDTHPCLIPFSEAKRQMVELLYAETFHQVYFILLRKTPMLFCCPSKQHCSLLNIIITNITPNLELGHIAFLQDSFEERKVEIFS